MRVLIIGAGGHGQVVADILLRMRDADLGNTPVGFLDDRKDLVGQTLLGVPILGAIADHNNIQHDAIIVAIGVNETRKRVFQLLQQKGQAFAIAQHPMSIVAPDVQIGAGSMICAGAVINTGTTVGAAVILNTGCTIDHHNHIGNYVHIAPGTHLGGEVEVGEGALIGIGATVMPRKRVGAWSIVGAGALVHRDVPARSVVVGVPCRVIKKL
jgi:sugar O-acyltransferase (sialic acid O-acetyltransferase NeuD family)